MTSTTEISFSAAIVASQALAYAIKRQKDFIDVLKGHGNADDITIALFEKHLQEEKDAFKEVAGYEWFD